MWSEVVVFLPPGVYFVFSIFLGKEPVHIQTLVPKAAIEGFNKGVVSWFSWP